MRFGKRRKFFLRSSYAEDYCFRFTENRLAFPARKATDDKLPQRPSPLPYPMADPVLRVLARAVLALVQLAENNRRTEARR